MTAQLPELPIKERLEKIVSWRETYGDDHNVVLPAKEAEALARYAMAGMEQEPVAWTDAEELCDLKHDGYAAMLSLSRKDCEHADPRRQILLFTHPAPLIRAAMLNHSEQPLAMVNPPVTGWLRADYCDDNRRGDAPLFVLGNKDPSGIWGVKYIPLSSMLNGGGKS